MTIFNQNLRTYQVDSRGDATYGFDNHFRFQVYRCFWPDCIKPTTTSTTTTTTTTLEGIFGILFNGNKTNNISSGSTRTTTKKTTTTEEPVKECFLGEAGCEDLELEPLADGSSGIVKNSFLKFHSKFRQKKS